MELDEWRGLQKEIWIHQTNCPLAFVDAAASIKTREDQLRQTARDLRSRVCKIEVDGGIYGHLL